ncbi:hypothetical protein D3C80_1894640 [compost metagenome]
MAAFKHVQGKTGAGFLLPIEQGFNLDAVLLAAEDMDRHRHGLTLAVVEAAAQQKIGTQDG